MLNRLINVAAVAPPRLKDAFVVLFESSPTINLLSCAKDMETLFSEARNGKPGVAFLYVTDDQCELDDGEIPIDQISQIKATWPDCCYIALVDQRATAEAALAAGADTILLKGASPDRVLQTILDCGGVGSDTQLTAYSESLSPTT